MPFRRGATPSYPPPERGRPGWGSEPAHPRGTMNTDAVSILVCRAERRLLHAHSISCTARRAAEPVRPPDAETKASAAGPLIAFESHGRPAWTPRNYTALAKEGYARNAIAYRCISLIAEASASVPWLLYDGAAEIDEHPLLSLLARPNKRPGRRRLPRGARRLSADRRQCLCRGRQRRWRPRASCTRCGPTA